MSLYRIARPFPSKLLYTKTSTHRAVRWSFGFTSSSLQPMQRGHPRTYMRWSCTNNSVRACRCLLSGAMTEQDFVACSHIDHWRLFGGEAPRAESFAKKLFRSEARLGFPPAGHKDTNPQFGSGRLWQFMVVFWKLFLIILSKAYKMLIPHGNYENPLTIGIMSEMSVGLRVLWTNAYRLKLMSTCWRFCSGT